MTPPQAIHPTTPSQQGFVFGTLAQASDGLYVEQSLWPLDGPLDAGRLAHALQRLIERHDILRTAFAWELSSAPRQVVLRAAVTALDVRDERDSDPVRQHASLERIRAAQAAELADLRRAPLLRVAVQRIGDHRSVLVWSHHHAILDGWSQLILLSELLCDYHGRPAPRLATPYGVYANWLKQRSDADARTFWQRELDGAAALPALRMRAPAADGRDRYGSREITLPAPVLRGLAQFTTTQDTTLGAVVIAAWALVDATLHGVTETIVGVTVSGRSPDFADAAVMVGPFASTMPLRATLQPRESFAHGCRHLQERVAASLPHSHLSAGTIHALLDWPADRALFHSVVAFANYPLRGIDAAGGADDLVLSTAGVRTFGGRTTHPLALVATSFDGLALTLVNDRRRVDDDTASAALDAFVGLLAALGENLPAGTALAALAQVRQLVLETHDGSRAAPSPAGSIEAAVRQAVAVVLGRDDVAADGDFFSAGGHSLLALRLLSTLRTRFALDLTLRDLFAASTPRAIAGRIAGLLGLPQQTRDSDIVIVPTPATAEPAFALSEIQQAYWIGRQHGFELSGVDAHLYVEIDIDHLDLERLRGVWRRLVTRHPMLRAVMTADGRQRIVDDADPCTIPAVDLSDRASDAALAEIRQRMSMSRRPPDALRLYDIEAALLGSGVTRLFLSFDLLIGDAQSWRVLYAEAMALYADPSSTLEPLDITYRDYLRAVEQLPGTADYARSRDYWRDRLQSLPAPPAFPLERGLSDAGPVRFVRRATTLTPAQNQRLRAHAAELGCTTAVLLLTLFARVLGRFTNSREFLLNLTVFNRLPLHPQVDALVGDFTSLSLLAVALDDRCLAEQARAIQRQLWTDLDHRHYSGIAVLRDLATLRETPTAALAPVVFTSTLDMGLPDSDTGPLPGRVVYAIGQTPQVLFDYQTYELGAGLVVNWDTLDGLFPPGFLDPMFATHEDLLRRLADDPRLVVATDLFEDAPIRFDHTEPLGGRRLLHDPFVNNATSHPGRIAVVSDGRRFSYGELLAHARAVARKIGAATAGPGPVAVVMYKGWEQVVGALGALLAGRPFVPIDATTPPRRIAAVLERTASPLVLTQSHVDIAAVLPPAVHAIDVDRLPPDDGSGGGGTGIRVGCDDLAYIVFTSGSTGVPKGVMIPHKAALNTVLDVNRRFGVDAADTILAVSSFAFDLSIYDVFGILAAGGNIVIPPESARHDPSAWADLVARESVTVWNSAPVLLKLTLDAVDGGRLASLRLCLLSGDWIPVDLPHHARARIPGVEVVSLGGATEGSIWSICHRTHASDRDTASVPYGRALGGQTVCVVDTDLRACPAWVAGEIVIGGHGVAAGYYGEPALTAERFVREPASGAMLYRTGDYGRLRPDGVIEFLGRKDDQVKIGGHRVELREVESAIRACAGVDDAVVVASGERTDRSLAAFVIGSASEADVRAAVASTLPRYMIPTRVTFVDRMVLTSTGKIDRRALAESIRAEPRAVSTGTSGPVEPGVHDLVVAALGTPVDAHANLLEHGLTSLGVIRLINAIDRTFSVRPGIEAFYASPTSAQLGADVRRRVAAAPAQPAAGHEREPADSQWQGADVIDDPAARQAFRSARPVYFDAPDTRIFPPPALEAGHRRPRSARSFSDAAVAPAALAQLLSCLRRTRHDGERRFAYPSAGGLYGVNAFVHVRPGRVEGLAAGLYCYHPDAHDLVPIVADVDLDPQLHAGEANRLLARTAAFLIFLITDPADSIPLYGAQAKALNLLNAGYIGQLLCTAAPAAGIALCPLHGYDFDAIRWLFPSAARVALLHFLAGGSAYDGPPRAEPDHAAQRSAAVATATAPLSPGQERLLDAEYALPGGDWPQAGDSGRMRPLDTVAVLVSGPLRVDALSTAIDRLVERQAALRTTFRFCQYGKPVQIVMPYRPGNLGVRTSAERVDGGSLADFLSKWTTRHVAPDDARLFRAELFKQGHDRHLLLLHIHHLVSDGWSIGLIHEELSELYNAALHGRRDRLGALGRGFAKTCVALHAERDGREMRRQLDYWRDEFAERNASGATSSGVSAGPALVPVDDIAVTVARPLVERLRAASARAATAGGLAGPLLAALAVLIHRRTGADEICIGNMIAARTNENSERLVGYFVNTVVVRLSPLPETTLADLLATVNRKLAAAMENQDVPIQDVLVSASDLPLPGAAPHTVTLALNGPRPDSLTLDGVECTGVHTQGYVDLAGPRTAASAKQQRWVFDERTSGVHGSLTYDTRTFTAEDIRLLRAHFDIVLEAIAGPSGTVGELIRQLDGEPPRTL